MGRGSCWPPPRNVLTNASKSDRRNQVEWFLKAASAFGERKSLEEERSKLGERKSEGKGGPALPASTTYSKRSGGGGAGDPDPKISSTTKRGGDAIYLSPRIFRENSVFSAVGRKKGGLPKLRSEWEARLLKNARLSGGTSALFNLFLQKRPSRLVEKGATRRDVVNTSHERGARRLHCFSEKKKAAQSRRKASSAPPPQGKMA